MTESLRRRSNFQADKSISGENNTLCKSTETRKVLVYKIELPVVQALPYLCRLISHSTFSLFQC